MPFPAPPVDTFTTKVDGPGNFVDASHINVLQNALVAIESIVVGPMAYNPLAPVYGAKGDVRSVTDGTITSGQATLSSATANFTSADAGKLIVVQGAVAGTPPVPLVTTIQSVTSPTTVVLTSTASATVSGAGVAWGTDNSTAINAAIAAAASAGGGLVYLSSFNFGIAGSIIHKNNVILWGPGAVLTQLGSFTTGIISNDASVPLVNAVVRDLTLDGQNITNSVGLRLHSPQDCNIANVKVRNAVGGLYIFADVAGTTGSPYASHNAIFNCVTGLKIQHCFAGFFFSGVGLALPGIVTDNYFFGVTIYDCFGTGIRLDQWTDSNHFYGVEIAITAVNTTGVAFNTSTTIDQGVYENNFHDLTVDAFSLTGVVIINFGFQSKQNRISQLETSPEPLNSPPTSPFVAGSSGTLIVDTNAQSYYVEVTSEVPPAVYTKGWSFTFGVAATGIFTLGSATGGAITISSGAASSFSVTNANLTLQTLTGGDIVITSAHALTMSGVANSSISVTGANLTIQTITSGTLALLAGGAMTITAGGALTLTLGAASTVTLPTSTTALSIQSGLVTIDTTNGRVGIGIAPGSKFDVVGNGTGHLMIGDPGLTNYVGFSLMGTLDNAHYTMIGAAADTTLYLNSAGDYSLRTSNVEVIHLSSDSTLTTQARAATSVAVSANYTVAATVETVFATAGAGGITVTLPNANVRTDRIITVKKVDSGAGAVTVKSAGGTLDGVAAATGLTIANQYSVLTLQSNGTNWFVIGQKGT